LPKGKIKSVTDRRQTILHSIQTVAEALGSDIEKFVLVGGAAAALLIDNIESGDIRPTDDVDLVSDINTYSQYNELTEVLRKEHGFKHDINGPLCRFIVGGVTVDILPTNENVLQFANKWYSHAIASSIPYILPSGIKIKLISPAVFLSTKLDAFKDRGQNDYYGSHDLEDIVTLIDAREDIFVECAAANDDIKTYLSTSFKHLMQEQDFLDSLEGFLPLGSETRLARLKEKLTQLAKL
jgi:predicted nucleotidyltransferase